MEAPPIIMYLSDWLKPLFASKRIQTNNKIGGMIMKKGFYLFVLICITCGLAACNNENAQDVYTKAIEVTEKMESAEIEMDMTQQLQTTDGAMEMMVENKSDAQIILEPLTMHQTGTMNMEMNGSSTESETEVYMTEDTWYTYDSLSDTWTRLDATMIPDLTNTQQQNPRAQLKMLEPFINDVAFKKTDAGYVFSYAGEGEEVKEFTAKLLEEVTLPETMAGLGEAASEMLEGITVNKLNYEMIVDKDTYETKTFKMDLDMSMESNGEKMNMKQNILAAYTGINTINSIEIPQEVLEHAIDLNP